jgi:hypothetical protein
MSELSVRDVAEIARRKVASGDPCWPFPIVNDLENACRASAVAWAVKVLESYLDEFASKENRQIRQEWLHAVPMLYDRSSHDIGPIAREIWFHGGTRDKWQRGMSRLYEAVAAFLEGRNGPYRRCVAMAVGVLTSEDHGRIDARRAEQCIYQYLCNRDFVKDDPVVARASALRRSSLSNLKGEQ